MVNNTENLKEIVKTNDYMQNLNFLYQIEFFVQLSVKTMVNDKKENPHSFLIL